jgi:hypothetical protein
MTLRHFILFLLPLLFAATLPAETRVVQAIPQQVFVEAGGAQAQIYLSGQELPGLRGVRAYQGTTPTACLLPQMTEPLEDRVNVFLVARPDAPLVGDYRIAYLDAAGKSYWLPVSITVVKPGDPRATKDAPAKKLEDAAQSGGREIVVDESSVPTITETSPSPLYLLPNGQAQPLTFKGRNFKGITSVRLRKSSAPPLYRKKQGEIPFQFKDDVLSLQLTVPTDTKPGTAYKIDFLAGRFLALSVELPVVAEAPPALPPAPPVAMPTIITTPPPDDIPSDRIIRLPGT